jgi:hypothetical protein
MYKIETSTSDNGTESTSIRRLSDMASIPTSEANTDYQEYLKWVAEGGVPLPPDSQE